MNILDIVQNSVRAGASLIEIEIIEDTEKDIFSFSVRDNGCGMSRELVEKVMDPFVTTRTTRKVGLGISLLRSAAQAAGGDILIESAEGVGTFLKAWFSHKSIDRQPLGDIAGTVVSLVSMNTQADFIYKHTFNSQEFVFETKEIKNILGEVSLAEPSVAQWIKEYIEEGITEIYGGVK